MAGGASLTAVDIIKVEASSDTRTTERLSGPPMAA